jgi:hypothetical protein
VYVNATTAQNADSTTIQSVDSAAGTITRVRTSDGRVDSFALNKPIDGTRSRTFPGSVVIQFPFNGLGITASINSVPAVGPAYASHLYAMSVTRD